MGFINHRNLVSVWVVFCCLCLDFGTAIETITSSELIKDPETLSSNSGTFSLGFFSPENSRNPYVGIWYLSESNIIWVANRNQPLSLNSSGIVTISVDGNLVVLNNEREAVWSSNVTHIANNSTAKLLETGNLVLLDGTTGEVKWESFKHPSDVYVPNMKVSNNRITGEKMYFTSWKSPSDPPVGYCSFTLERLDAPELFFWVNGTHPYYRTGPWNGRVFIGFPQMSSGFLNGWSVRNEDDGTVYLSFEYANKSDFAIAALIPQGTLKIVGWNNKKETWNFELQLQETNCDVYGMCGAFGSCNSQTSPICSCLSGYQPKNLEEWNRKNWTGGCVGKVPLQCGSEVSKDGFLKLENTKVPDYVERSSSLEDECRAQCLKNCSCVAYAYDSGIGCMFWSGHLVDIQRFSYGGADLYIRVAPSELDAEKQYSDKRRDKRLIIAVGVTIGIITLAGCAYLSWKWTAKYTGISYLC